MMRVAWSLSAGALDRQRWRDVVVGVGAGAALSHLTAPLAARTMRKSDLRNVTERRCNGQMKRPVENRRLRRDHQAALEAAMTTTALVRMGSVQLVCCNRYSRATRG